MKRNRIILSLLWILSVVGISFYGGPVTYGFFIMMTMIPVLSYGYLFAVRLRFSIYQRLEGKTFVSNHAIPFYFTLQNEDWFAFASVRVHFYSDFSSVLDLNDGEECELLPEDEITRDTTLICKYRGTYMVGIRSVEITDFLRLFRMTYKNPEPLEVTINPQTVTLSELRSINLSRVLSREYPAGRSVPDLTVRDYIPGDDRRRIHWKATARTNQLMTRLETGEEQQNISIILSTCRYSSKQADYLPTENRMLEIALALSRYFVLQGIPVRAYHRAGVPVDTAVNDNVSFASYYELLCGISFFPTEKDNLLFDSLCGAEAVLSGRAAFLILARWTAAAEDFVRLLNANGVSVVVYLVSDSSADLPGGLMLPRTEIITVSPDVKLEEVL
ncbi:MAG: DUF58 domain-containing protein [Lachnospiraceae bacterium]|nr:DUF58 domain-containing protein [Lachnospiraceae bacterium]